MDIISWIKTTLSKYSSNNTHDKNAIYFVKNEDGKTGKIISDEVVYGNGGGANGVVVESPNQPTGGESVWVNPDEDTEEVEVYSRQQTDALINTKQNELTLTVKDNGNIVIANIQGQSKEFMPATPSGDPMHYAYEAVGAVWNGTGADIVKTAPWAELADDDADKTVVHKAGYWYLNGLGDLTNKDMRLVYFTPIFNGSESKGTYYQSQAKTVVCSSQVATVFLKIGMSVILRNSNFVIFGNNLANTLNVNDDLLYAFSFSKIFAILFTIKLGSTKISLDYSPFLSAYYLKYVKLKGLNGSVNISNSSLLSCKSILYMIQNEAATSAITITLHADAYARAMANADILAALEAHPNVSLASA